MSSPKLVILQDWKTVQALVGKTGKEGLKRRCLECVPEKINKDASNRAKELFHSFGLEDVRDVSAGAATFYVWVSVERSINSKHLKIFLRCKNTIYPSLDKYPGNTYICRINT